MNLMKNIQEFRYVIITLVALVALIFQCVTIYELYQSEVLWGHRLLWAWITFLTMYTSFFLHVCRSEPKVMRRIFYSSLSGILMYVGFMPNFFFVGIFIGFVPLLLGL